MKSVEKILQTVKREGAVTAKQIADELSMTTMGARQHLQALEDDGLLAFEDLKVKVGRPTRHWSLTQKGHAQFADRHGELTIQVIEAVESLFGSDGLQKVADEREAQTYQFYASQLEQCRTLEQKLARLVELRQQEGYMAEFEVKDKGFVLIENHCPICKAATRCPSLCQSELNIFQRLLGEGYTVSRSEHIVSGERRCVYHIAPR
ncbi:helix-turn-helix transcriptional regulator [Vibrio sinaloensis]|uniref:helix-turn-helix transcriptional regulator n=1 Tax=Photobacterium sp. (strain ATCC 43367) TaxID=379097 RepID=UPI002058C074|nr:metalloregulator ArsR/SmtB family transcription factor [Vibrio sinaloensis]UPQ88142.1 transcriptional regulator [Vibrio sinaloensis]